MYIKLNDNFDPSYINKSGKKTFGLGMYWSGCAGNTNRGEYTINIATERVKKDGINIDNNIDIYNY